jgi:hypothetical protein
VLLSIVRTLTRGVVAPFAGATLRAESGIEQVGGNR